MLCTAVTQSGFNSLFNDSYFSSYRTKKKILVATAGNTLGCHKKFIKKLKKKGASEVTDKDKSDIVILFCPIVSRFECDITAALSYAKGKDDGCENKQISFVIMMQTLDFLSFPPPKENKWNKLVLVAMHHTFDKAYVLPQHRNIEGRGIELLVECLFHENTGLLKCPRNKEAQKKVCQEVSTYQLVLCNYSVVCCNCCSYYMKLTI